MTVKELIELLREMPPDALVVLSRDSEGNDYSELHSYWEGLYVNSEGYGEMHVAGPLTDELREQGYTESDVAHGGIPAICLIP